MRKRAIGRLYVPAVCLLVLVAACGGIAESRGNEERGSGDSELHLVTESHPLVENFQSVDDLTQESGFVIRGTVAEVLDPILVRPGEDQFERHDPDMYEPVVYTDFVVQVSETLKGDVDESVIVRQVGGTVDEYTSVFEGTVEIAPGDDVVLFLNDYSEQGYGDVLWMTGVYQGFWRVGPDSELEPPREIFQVDTLQELREEVAGASS